jgi:hypothetical protein
MPPARKPPERPNDELLRLGGALLALAAAAVAWVTVILLLRDVLG